MKKTTHFILFLLFFSIALSIVAKVPSDENFEENTIFDSISNDFSLDGVAACAPTIGITKFDDTTITAGSENLNQGSGSAYAANVYNTCWDISATGGGTVYIRGQNNQGQLGDRNMAVVTADGVSSFSVSSNDNSKFKLKKTYIKTTTAVGSVPGQITITGKSNGANLPGATLTQSGLSTNVWILFDTNLDSDFNAIDEFVVTMDAGTHLQVRFEDIEIGAAVMETAPTVTTSAATSITATGVTFNGNVTSDGGATVTARGFVYSSTDNAPTIGETGVTQVTDGSGTGAFSEAVSGLNASTTYYYRAYATNSEGTAYGGVESFTTQVANAPPIIDANTGLLVTQGATGYLDSGKLHFNDDETEDDAHLIATITTAVAHGILFLDVNLNNTLDLGEEELIVNSTFTQDDVNNERIRYTSTVANETSDSFVFKVTDSDGGELSNQTFNITINQVPTVTVNNGLTLDEGTTELIDSGKLNANDAESGGGSDITFTITSAVSHGILFIDSNPTTVFEVGDIELIENATFTLDDINNDKLRYTNTVGNQTTDSFEFKVSDPDGGELANQTFTITINLLEEPTVTTAAPIDVTTTTATLGGEVTNSGSSAVTERGIVYNITGTPTITDSKIQIGSGIGSFAQEIIALTAGTTYYMRAYATNAVGTSYGNEESFITSALAIDDNQIKNAISLYPNPVNNLLYINNHIIKVDKVSLFDVFGKRIDGIKIENQAINLSKIKTGIYLLKIETDRGNVVKRIVKE